VVKKKEGRESSRFVLLPHTGEMAVMYDKILVAVDQSLVSDRAVLAARDLAQLSRSTAHKVIHLTDRPVLIVPFTWTMAGNR
jgi:nucleotide-binding universal stress UspA family protein